MAILVAFQRLLWGTIMLLPAAGALCAQEIPNRTPELRELDVALARIVEMSAQNAKDRNLLPLIERVALKVEMVIRNDLTNHSDDSVPWIGSDALFAIWSAFKFGGRAAEEQKWRELLLLAAANASLPTSYGGAAWYYDFLIDAKYGAPGIFERALDLEAHARNTTCGEVADFDTRKVCNLRLAGEVLRETGATQAGVELEQDALERLRAGKPSAPETLLETLLSLTYSQWVLGSGVVAENLLEQAIATSRDLSMSPRAAFALEVMQAERSRMRLDDAAAAKHLSNASKLYLNAQEQRTGNFFEDRLIDQASSALLNLITQYSRMIDCDSCVPAHRAIAAFLAEMTSQRRTDGASGRLPGFILELVGSIDAGGYARLLSEGEREQLETAIRSNIIDAETLGAVATRAGEANKSRALHLAIAASRLTSFGISASDAAEFLTSRDLKTAQRRGATLLATIRDSNLGADLDVIRWAPKTADLLNAQQALPAERVLLDFVSAEFSRLATSEAVASDLAVLIVPVFARLAQLELQAGRLPSARAWLDKGSASALLKLRREWRNGQAQSAGAFRELAPALAENLNLRVAVAAKSRAKGDEEAAFLAFQLVLLNDTASVVQAANTRRIASEPALAKAISEQAIAEAAREKFEAILRASTLPSMAGVEREAATARRTIEASNATIVTFGANNRLSAALEPVLLADAKGALTKDEALLLMHTGKQAVVSLLLQPSGAVRIWSSPIDEHALAATVRAIRAGIDTTDGYRIFPVNTAANLFEVLLGPARKQLAEVRHIVVVTDGALQSLPLSILPTESIPSVPDTLEGLVAAEVKWLVRTHAVSVAPGLHALVEQRLSRRGSKAPRPFIGIGNPELDGEPGLRSGIGFNGLYTRGSSLADVEAIKRFPALPDTETEIRELAKAFSADASDVLLGAQATEARVKSHALSQYRVVVFATHGLVAGEAGSKTEPGLVLTPPAQASTNDDGLLTASEIMSLKLDADLVVLSACNTAASDGRPRAEALSGLALSFFAAGAMNLLVTHWEIPTRPAVEITTGAARAWMQDNTLTWPKALQRAQTQLASDRTRPEYAHPASWGAFQLIGASLR